MHEIVTLQLGQRANYLATHFWNLQESYFTYNDGEQSDVDHDVHFRPGVGADGSETYTPRTVIYDLKGGFGTLRRYNALYELSEDSTAGQGLWDGREVVQKQTPIQQSEYQKSLDLGTTAPRLTSEAVRYWSDYNRVLCPLRIGMSGKRLFKDLDKEHDLLDRDLRPLLEECDHLRALQLFSGSDDAWGGFTAQYMERLRDEFGKKSIWVWAIEDGTKIQRHHQFKKDTNKARSLCSISPLASLYSPIIDVPHNLPGYLKVDRQSEWQKTALLASAIETVTLPSRLRPYQHFEASLAGEDGTHTIFELQSSINKIKINDGQTKEASNEDGPTKAEIEFDIDFAYDGEYSKGAHTFNQVQVTRGEEPERDSESTEDTDVGYLRKLRRFNSESMLQSFHTPLSMPILDSFPDDMFPTPEAGTGVNVFTALTASTRTAQRIKAISATAGRLVSVDEREALVNGLGEIREYYETGWSSGSDDDDD
ncbi:hypothetical protein N7516_005649 [Penicillium verrucosum]|uniref:uncharacterized protein n=1 Tax=Penicillium verrucosum TaxID=60171 RepID=UPI002545B315|nr:uncharacterized protein N7516_005649 [Penicillium verrucosum]KAJ5945481.1 hypothetical protein N7516_005649 [Penicillium verrucosum]